MRGLQACVPRSRGVHGVQCLGSLDSWLGPVCPGGCAAGAVPLFLGCLRPLLLLLLLLSLLTSFVGSAALSRLLSSSWQRVRWVRVRARSFWHLCLWRRIASVDQASIVGGG